MSQVETCCMVPPRPFGRVSFFVVGGQDFRRRSLPDQRPLRTIQTGRKPHLDACKGTGPPARLRPLYAEREGHERNDEDRQIDENETRGAKESPYPMDARRQDA